jgi:drug/metabolite transporter (DMT)-like permease
MLAILGGLGAALGFATSTLCAARSSRLIGAPSVVAWMMIVGAVAILPLLALAGPVRPDGQVLIWAAAAGGGNVLGLLLEYHAFRFGKIGIVAPIASTEGAVAAVLAVLAGEILQPGVGITLGVIVVGVALAAAAPDGGSDPQSTTSSDPRPASAAALAVGSAICFGLSLFGTAQISTALPVAWAVLPARLAGVLLVALPLALLSRLRLTRSAAPLVVLAGLAEVFGFASFAIGSGSGIAVSAVLASQFAAIAAVGAYFLFGERLGRLQLAGAATIIAGVTVLAVLQNSQR